MPPKYATVKISTVRQSGKTEHMGLATVVVVRRRNVRSVADVVARTSRGRKPDYQLINAVLSGNDRAYKSARNPQRSALVTYDCVAAVPPQRSLLMWRAVLTDGRD